MEFLIINNMYYSKYDTTIIRKFVSNKPLSIKQHVTIVKTKKEVQVQKTNGFELDISKVNDNSFNVLKPYIACDNYYYFDKNHGILVIRLPLDDYAGKRFRIIKTSKLIAQQEKLPFKTSPALKIGLHIRI